MTLLKNKKQIFDFLSITKNLLQSHFNLHYHISSKYFKWHISSSTGSPNKHISFHRYYSTPNLILSNHMQTSPNHWGTMWRAGVGTPTRDSKWLLNPACAPIYKNMYDIHVYILNIQRTRIHIQFKQRFRRIIYHYSIVHPYSRNHSHLVKYSTILFS